MQVGVKSIDRDISIQRDWYYFPELKELSRKVDKEK